jgi:hypothetical protein
MLIFSFAATVFRVIGPRMKTSLAFVLGALLAGCAGSGSVGEDSAALGDNGGVKGIFRSSAVSPGAFTSLDFPCDGTFSGTLAGGNTVAGEVHVNPPRHVTLHFNGIGGSSCARLGAASVVTEGWATDAKLALADVCNGGTTYTLTSDDNR